MNSSIFIVLDNLRVGGIQRLALDEAYALSRAGYKVRIYTLEQYRSDDSMREVDSEYFNLYKDRVILKEICRGLVVNLLGLRKDIEKYSPEMIISHSAKGIFISRIATIGTRPKPRIIGFVHQLISLSSDSQKFKRIIFFQFADDLRASSFQFVLDLLKLREDKGIYRVIMKRLPKFDRMGVYLERIEYFRNRNQKMYIESGTGIIFLSRVVSWKGFETFYSICLAIGASSHKIVFSCPLYLPLEQIENFKRLKNHHILIHKGIAEVFPGEKFVHIYPTTYGRKVKYPQNIGLNVLECLAVGVPSLISEEDFLSWPELKDSPLVVTTDWSIKDVQNKIDAFYMLSKSAKREEQTRVLPIISIESHIKRILEISER